MIISVAGNTCSGKTTLAKKISALYGFTYIPYKRSELNFLDVFFQNIPAHFLATQTAFLINKITEIKENSRKNNLVIDRSLFEDIRIFAQLWMDNYPIDEKEKILYQDLADYLLTTIPRTDVYLFCRCEEETVLERFASRERRPFENRYPSDYIQKLCRKYDTIRFPDDAIVVELDAKHLDFRNDEAVIEIMAAILQRVNDRQVEQLSFFDEGVGVRREEDLSPYARLLNNPEQSMLSETLFEVKSKQIYLAAPFTEFATVEESEGQEGQLPMPMETKRDYNILPKSYQRTLKRIKKLLSNNGKYNVILPHEDENNWGKTYLSNSQIVEAMVTNLKKSDLIVAVVSNSIGVHMEMAMMSIQDKPMVLVIVDEATSGFYAQGYQSRKNVLILHAKTISAVYRTLSEARVLEFIRRTINHVEMDREKL